jgi:hypothetical protein
MEGPAFQIKACSGKKKHSPIKPTVMHRKKNMASAPGMIVLLALLNVIITKQAYTGDPALYKALFITLPLLAVAVFINIKTDRHEQSTGH